AVDQKSAAFEQLQQNYDFQARKRIADTWCAAFVIRKQFREPTNSNTAVGITQRLVNELARGQPLPEEISREVDRLTEGFRLFHWHLEFPDVFANGGFDAILGNPPWVRQELLKPVKQLLVVFESFASTADSSVYFLE